MADIFVNPTFVLFAVLFLGLLLGNISVKGISLGSSGVLFVALAAGHFGLKVPDGVIGMGTALFVYCVGLGVGNRFFASLRSKGSALALLAVIVVGVAGLVAWGLCGVMGIDSRIATGLFAGACTSTPAFAAATESVQDAQGMSAIGAGYAVAYPFGVVGVVLFVQLLPRLLKKSLEAPEGTDSAAKDPHKIISRVVTVTNPEAIGHNIGQFLTSSSLSCRITREVKDGLLHPLDAGAVFAPGMQVYMVGERAQVEHEAGMIGHIDEMAPPPRSFGDESDELIVLAQALCNKTLRELDTLNTYGILISRITRLGATFIPTADTELIRNDVVRVVGKPQAIAAFRKACGHRSSAINATDILSLAGGVTLGIFVGNINFSIGNGPGFSLGMAGGPLLVALILGHFGKIGPIEGYMPRPTRVLLMDLALMIYLAGAGVSGGEHLVETLQQHGISMFLVGMAITLVPLFAAYIIARKYLRMGFAESLGGICGSMTSTPALGAISSKTDRQEPVIAYATAYPAALILMIIFAKLLLGVL